MNYVDQIGQTLKISNTPKRIISLVPSQTELLIDLGLQDAVVGITKFCVHPKEIRKSITVVGGTKQIHLDRIKNLNPDIIIANKEENTFDIVQACKAVSTVWVSDISDLGGAIGMITSLGEILGKSSEAQEIVSNIILKKEAFESGISNSNALKVAYVIWQNPYMVAGNDTFINALLEINGYENVIQQQRYPEVSVETLKKADIVFLSSEPFPFKERHALALEQELKKPVILVDGEFFSWYGSRLIEAFDYFLKLQSAVKEIFN